MTELPYVPPPTRHPMGLFLRRFAPLYAVWIARQNLDGVFAIGLDDVRRELEKGPVILAANHLSWWDGQIMLIVNRALGVDGRFFIVADRAQELSYLRHLGGITIDRVTVGGTIGGIEEAAAFLSGPGRLLWIFPQGRYRAPSLRPLGLERGVSLLHRMSGAVVIPTGMLTGWRDLHVPAWAIGFAAPVTGRDRFMERLEAAIVSQLESLELWFDTPGRAPLPAIVPSVIVPFENRFGSRFYLFWARLWGALAGLFKRR